MPELPEVETIRRGLSSYLPGLEVKRATSDTAKSFPNDETLVANYLVGARISSVTRRAKVLIIELDNDYALIIHLKMTGQLIFVGKERWGGGHPNDSLIGELPDKSTRVVFCFHDHASPRAIASEAPELTRRNAHYASPRASLHPDISSPNHALYSNLDHSDCTAHLYFNDFRKFGWIRLVPKVEIPEIDFFRKVGPEPLGTEFTWQYFKTALARRKRTSIKAAILDQTVLAGVGNIYADESLYAARIHPATKVEDVPEAKLKKLWEEIPKILQLSIDHGGSSDKNYVDADGNRGSYLKFAKVFRRDGEECPECGGVIEKIRVAGRGTHFCPTCQKLPLKRNKKP